MLSELKATNADLNIEILGVNRIDESAFNALMTEDRHLPWLQDTDSEKVWERWAVTYRDVRILNSQNGIHAIFNLSDYNLDFPENRETLKRLFVDAAKVVDSDRDGLPDDWELQHFGNLSAKPNEDPDGDGADNFTEFAFGTDPNDPKSYAAMRPGLIVQGQQNVLSVTFRRRAGAVLDYFIEASPDLQQWTANSTEVVIAQTPQILFDGTGTSKVRYSLTKPVSTSGSGFMRVRAIPRRQP